MNFSLLPALYRQAAISDVMKCNELTSRYGLLLSASEANQLVETREEALSSNGRIEFSGGIINKMITEFCDSPYLTQNHYVDTLSELMETFYYFKNESLDEISDDELLALMKEYFDGRCQGSIELLQGRELEALTRNVRNGMITFSDFSYSKDYPESENDEEDWDEEDWNEQY